MFTFGSPLYFLLFAPLGVAAWFVYRSRARAAIVFSGVPRLAALGPSWRTAAAGVLPALTLLGLALGILALARPRTVLSEIRRTANVIAIQMTVDVSGSMQALDLSDVSGDRIIRPRSRLDVVKDTFSDFIKRRPDDMIGLVTFGGYASSRCPLTTDHGALLHVLEGVEIPKPTQAVDGSVADQEELMTAVGDALATACARLTRAEPKSKIIVLLSDGESNTGIIQPPEAIAAARKLGIKVYTIGVGTTGRAPFPARDVFGRDVVQWADVTLDEKLLARIATETGGRYFNVRDPRGLERALEDIARLETTRVEREVYEQYDEWFPYVLVPGLVLVALGTGLNMLIAQRLL